MPVADQWKLRETSSVPSSPPAVASPTSPSSGLTAPSTDGRLPLANKLSASGSSSSAAEITIGTESVASSATSPGGRSTKNLAGFWSSQNDEVKVRKKRLVQVDGNSTSEIDAADITGGRMNESQDVAGQAAVEHSTSVDSHASTLFEIGKTRNTPSAFQQQPERKLPSQSSKTFNVTDRWSVMSNESSTSGRHSSTSSSITPEAVLNRKSDAIVLAENQPVELGADVVRSEGSSWDDVAELEAGRTKNLLARWKATEQEYAVPKTSTSRYSGSKPAWILEIEAAKETSTGAIGSSWTGDATHITSDEQPETVELENPSSSAGYYTASTGSSRPPTASEVALRDGTTPERIVDGRTDMTVTSRLSAENTSDAAPSLKSEESHTTLTSVEKYSFDERTPSVSLAVTASPEPPNDTANISASSAAIETLSHHYDDSDDVYQPSVESADWSISFSTMETIPAHDHAPETAGLPKASTSIVNDLEELPSTSSHPPDDGELVRISDGRIVATAVVDDASKETFTPATEALPTSSLETIPGYDVLTMGFWSSTEPANNQIVTDTGDDEQVAEFATATGSKPVDSADVDEGNTDDDNGCVEERQIECDEVRGGRVDDEPERQTDITSGGNEDAQEQQQPQAMHRGKKRKDKDDKRKSTNNDTAASNRERRYCLVM